MGERHVASIGEIVAVSRPRSTGSATLSPLIDAAISSTPQYHRRRDISDAADTNAGQLQDVFAHAGVDDKATRLSAVHEVVNQLKPAFGMRQPGQKYISRTRGVGG
jgi:hypothetical protein